jgi:hypothetical protein
MPHTFYCSTTECKTEVKKSGETCDTCKEAMSYESSECPGCGEHILCGANGYCAGCWIDRFGIEDGGCSPKSYEHECTEVFDHEVGQWTCGDAEAHTCSGEVNDETGTRECDDKDDPKCPQHKCTNVYDHEIGQWTCGDPEAHKHNPLCDKCDNDFPSPIATLDDQIDNIEEKLRQVDMMTEGQTADWEFLWHNSVRKRRRESCSGCRDECLNQQGHMHPGGCLYERV